MVHFLEKHGGLHVIFFRILFPIVLQFLEELLEESEPVLL